MSEPEAPPEQAPEMPEPPRTPGPGSATKLFVFAVVFGVTLAALVQVGLIDPGRALGPGSQVGTSQGFGEVVDLVPRYGKVPDFRLIESSGDPVGLETLSGKVWIASFLFTRCAATCPAMADRNRILQNVLPEGTQLVSISVDPTRDTPEVLRDYAKFYQRVPGKWLLLTGEWKTISDLAQKGFYLAGEDPLLHSTRFALVDQLGNLRGYYDSKSEEEMANLVRDVSLVLAEATPEGPGGRPAPR